MVKIEFSDVFIDLVFSLVSCRASILRMFYIDTKFIILQIFLYKKI
jgi:hypothetical protein